MNEHELSFDTEFMSDEEVEEMLDNIVSTIGEKLSSDDIKTSIINPYRVKQVLYTYNMLKCLTKGTNANVYYKLHSPYKSMRCVSVTGSCLLFRNTELFMKAIELASNFEVYPKTDGTVQMNFTFHGLTMAID